MPPEEKHVQEYDVGRVYQVPVSAPYLQHQQKSKKFLLIY
jgi:hypothetical protein